MVPSYEYQEPIDLRARAVVLIYRLKGQAVVLIHRLKGKDCGFNTFNTLVHIILGSAVHATI